MKKIYQLGHNEIFVFGSNLRGRHGAGAALWAANRFGAEEGVAEGRSGSCYAIPTKDENIETLHISKINYYVRRFISYAKSTMHLKYFVTPIGCGLAGLRASDIAPMFKNPPTNVILPPEFANLQKCKCTPGNYADDCPEHGSGMNIVQ